METNGVFVSTDRAKLLTDGIVLQLKPVCSIEVVVKDVGGNPLEGAGVSLLTMRGRMGLSLLVGKTDAAGEMTVDGLCEGGRYQVWSGLSGYCPVRGGSEGTVSPGSPEWSDTVELAMEPATRVQKGKIVDENGHPVEGAEVWANVGDRLSATTDAEGSFTLKGLPDSSITLSAASGDLWGRAKVSKETPDIAIKLEKAER